MVTVQSVVGPGALHDGLLKLLMRAETQSSRAEQNLGAGKRRRAKALLGHAGQTIGKFGARLRSAKAKKTIPPDALAGMKSVADETRHDVITLRKSS